MLTFVLVLPAFLGAMLTMKVLFVSREEFVNSRWHNYLYFTPVLPLTQYFVVTIPVVWIRIGVGGSGINWLGYDCFIPPNPPATHAIAFSTQGTVMYFPVEADCFVRTDAKL